MSDGEGPRRAAARLQAGEARAGDALLVMYALGPATVRSAVGEGLLRDWSDRQLLATGQDLTEPTDPAEHPLWRFASTADGAPNAVTRLEAARAGFAGVGDALAEAFCWWRMAEEHAHRGDREATSAAADAARLASAEPTIEALALHAMAMQRIQDGHHETAQALIAEARALAAPEGALVDAFVAMAQGIIFETRAERAGAVAATEAAWRGFEAAGHPRYAAQARIFYARALLGADRAESAMAHLLAAPATRGLLAGARACVLGEAHLAIGDPAGARHRFAEAAAELTADSQFRWLAASGDLRAAVQLGQLDGPGVWQDVVAALPATPRDADFGVLADVYLVRAWALTTDGGAERLAAWADDHRDLALVAATCGLHADQAMAAGEPGAARLAIDRARAAAATAGPVPLRRSERQALEWECRYGTVAPDAVQPLIDEARRVGDAFGEARARLLAARCHEDPDRAASEAIRALTLAELRGLAGVRAEAAALTWLFGGKVERPEVAAPELRVLVAAGDVRRGAALTALAAALASVPAANRPHLQRLAGHGLRAAGLRILRDGPPPVILLLPGSASIEETSFDFGRAKQLLDLFEVIAVRGEQLDRTALFESVWRQPYRPPSSDNTLHVNVTRLRARLGNVVEIVPTDSGSFRLQTGCMVARRG